MTPWTAVHQAPLSIWFSRQECWSMLPFPSPGDLPNPGIQPGTPALQDSLPTELQRKPYMCYPLINSGDTTVSQSKMSCSSHSGDSQLQISISQNNGRHGRYLQQGIEKGHAQDYTEDRVDPVKWYLSQDLTEESHHPGIHRVAGTENLRGLAHPGEPQGGRVMGTEWASQWQKTRSEKYGVGRGRRGH